MNEKQANRLIFAGAFGLVMAIWLVIYLLLWNLWTWVVPQVWPAGPVSFTQPGFWPFAGMWFLITMFFRAIRGK